LLIETLEELCRFLDQFPFAVHLVGAVDETNALRLSMLERLAGCLEESVRKVLRSLDTDSCVFSYRLAPALAVLTKRLRPSNFLGVAQQLVSRLAALLVRQLLRQAPFSHAGQLELFVANCREDLRGALASSLEAVDLRPLQPLWEGCALLALPGAEAAEVLALLRRLERCRPAAGMLRGLALSGRGEAGPPSCEEARQLAEALARAGVEELAALDVAAVLGKRPDLASAAADLVDSTPLGLLQDLPAAAAQATFHLGAGALQQLGAQAPLPVAAAQASLQTSVAELRGLAGGAGRLFTGRLRSTLGVATAAA